MRSKFFGYIVDTAGNAIEGSRINVYVYPLGGGTATYANIYLTDSSSVTTTYATELLTDANGYFEFYIADLEEGGAYGYEYQREFKLAWSGGGGAAGSIDKLQIFDVTKRSVDVTDSGTSKNRLISNLNAKNWETHRSDTARDDHTQYLKTNGSRVLGGNWDTGGVYHILLNTLKSRPSADMLITSNDGSCTLELRQADAGVRANKLISSGNIAGATLTISGAATVGSLSAATLAISTSINLTGSITVGGASSSFAGLVLFGDGLTVSAGSTSLKNTAITGTLSVTAASTLASAIITSLSSNNATIGGGSINSTPIGQTNASLGKFTTLECITFTGPALDVTLNEGDAVSVTSLYSATFVKTGTLSVSGNTSLGDASGDILTLNGTAIAIPNNLNINSGALSITTASSFVGIGTGAPASRLDVFDNSGNEHIRLSFSPTQYVTFGCNANGTMLMTSVSTSADVTMTWSPYHNNTYNLGATEKKWKDLYIAGDINANVSMSLSASHFRGNDGWILIGATDKNPTAPIDIISDTLRIRTSRTPSSSSAPGNVGEICWDSTYIYVCTATNTWKRAGMTSW